MNYFTFLKVFWVSRCKRIMSTNFYPHFLPFFRLHFYSLQKEEKRNECMLYLSCLHKSCNAFYFCIFSIIFWLVSLFQRSTKSPSKDLVEASL